VAEEQGFAQARARLEEIVVQVRKKDTSLEQSLDLLEEGVRLANMCTELVDHSEWRPAGTDETDGEDCADASPAPATEAVASAESVGEMLAGKTLEDEMRADLETGADAPRGERDDEISWEND
jgi:exodeoxyribonuclease VII small subunit